MRACSHDAPHPKPIPGGEGRLLHTSSVGNSSLNLAEGCIAIRKCFTLIVEDSLSPHCFENLSFPKDQSLHHLRFLPPRMGIPISPGGPHVLRPARFLAVLGLFLLVVASAGPISAQPAKKVLTFSDSDIWRTSSTPVLSPDGAHVAYVVWPGEGDGESVVRHIGTGKEFKFPRGGGVALVGPKFTPDGKRALLPLTPTKAEIEKAKVDKAKGGDAPQSLLAVVEVATGQIGDKFPQAGPYFNGGEGLGFVVYRQPVRPEAKKDDDDEKARTRLARCGARRGGKGSRSIPWRGGGTTRQVKWRPMARICTFAIWLPRMSGSSPRYLNSCCRRMGNCWSIRSLRESPKQMGFTRPTQVRLQVLRHNQIRTG